MRGILAVAGIGVLWLTGCVHTHANHPHGGPPGQVKKSMHVHGHGCGHVFTNGSWIAIEVGAVSVKDKPRK
jgi:hypothetical protein